MVCSLKNQLEIGNGVLTYDEAKTHFTAWALMKAPLLIGTDVSYAWVVLTALGTELLCQLATITSEMLDILKNTEIIAINQDPVYGTSISPFRWGINVGRSYALLGRYSYTRL
jgi:alpha-galactosidase